MMRVLAVSDGHSHFDVPIREYAHRLSRSVELVRLKPEKSADPALAVRRETERVVAYLEKERLRAILLDEFGTASSTLAFAESLRGRLDRGERIAFVVGGAFGLDRELLAPHLAGTLALSEFVMPHSLALLVLLEQLYRAHEVWKGSKYHHA